MSPRIVCVSVFALAAIAALGCTQETQNELGRAVQNWTGTDGVLDVYAADKLVKRFIKVDKLSTAYGTQDKAPRPYRYGYGILDENQNYAADPGEKKVYFEVSDYSTPYVFYENPFDARLRTHKIQSLSASFKRRRHWHSGG